MNINRDYLIINDVKKSNVKLDNGSMFFYITDKNTQNIFVNLVINVSNNDLIQKYANIENAEDYTLTMNIVKPDNTYKIIEGKLHDKEKAIFEFNLNEDCCDEIGTYRCELLTKCNIDGHEEITTSNKLTYKVKSSVLNDLDDIVEAPKYPLVIQLFDKLSDIEQYEEDRRANELARQLAEEQRQAKHNELVADMTDSIQAIDNKVVDVENRISAKEEAVDTLIVNTKADIDEYKVAKNQEIDEYKALKDTEINNAIAAQDNKIDETITAQNDRITVVENNDAAQNNKLDTLQNKATIHEERITATEVKNTEQDNRLDIIENTNTQQNSRLTTVEAKNVEQDNRLNEIEAIDVAQNTRLDAIEAKNQQQDDRLLDIEKVNKRQDMNLKCLFAESKNNMIDITEEGNSIYLQNSTTGYTLIDEIKGNTLVNCNKEPDKELILNGNINTSGDNTVTITEGVDGGLVDVSLEGNTLVNLVRNASNVTVENNSNGQISLDLSRIKTNQLYTVVIRIKNNTLDKPIEFSGWTIYNGYNTNNESYYYHEPMSSVNRNDRQCFSSEQVGEYRTLIGMSSITSGKKSHITLFSESGATGSATFECLVLEGDWTGKEIPQYFEGMKSVGECEELEITSANSDNSLSNTQQLTHEPLRAVGDVKDRYVLIGGKWYIERNCIEILSTDYTWKPSNTYETCKLYTVDIPNLQAFDAIGVVCDKLPAYRAGEVIRDIPQIAIGLRRGANRGLLLRLPIDIDPTTYINENPFKVVAPLATTVYEPIDYVPFGAYLKVTHITTNSVIPTNITVKNHGFNCLLKPSTTYTVSSNLGLNTVTTPSTLTEDCLRFMDTDTSDVTTMRDVLILEGDWTTKADLIPANFSGIESCFEQEYDIEKGKYKVNIKVSNEDKTKENNITFYINEPLRGVGTVKDKVYVKDDKVVVQRNCGIRPYEDGDFGTYPTDKIDTVYPLVEPTYEEVEYNDTKLFIESFKNSTLSYNSNVPVTSKSYYSYSVPIVDTVAQTANVTDQQDSMIIDLATQVAVMEMMLM